MIEGQIIPASSDKASTKASPFGIRISNSIHLVDVLIRVNQPEVSFSFEVMQS